MPSFFRESVFVAAEYVRQRGPFRVAARLNRRDVVSLQMATCGALDLTDSQNAGIRMQPDMQGHSFLLNQLSKNLAGHLIQGHVLELAELEKKFC